MCAASVRLGDQSTGHGCYPPRPNISASPNVFANGIPVHRVTDSWAVHGCPTCVPHGGIAAQGSPNVFANGLAKCRIGDAISCGDFMLTGSSTVFING